MSASLIHPFALTPHPAARGLAVRGIGGRVSRIPAGLLVSYVIEGDLERVRVPEPRPPRRADGLWRHTCCEVFLARQGQPAYHEFNFSPSGEWAVYAFKGTRERVPLDGTLDPDELDPQVTVCRGAEKLELDAVIRLDRLSPPLADAGLALGLSAVIEDADGALSYWALSHPLERPDFHVRAAFALELDATRP